jgi:hypothetical protein
MSRTLFILNDPPYDTEPTYHGHASRTRFPEHVRDARRQRRTILAARERSSRSKSEHWPHTPSRER